jgi:uncharacterized protein involved in exopolysaccharide biosynthesis
VAEILSSQSIQTLREREAKTAELLYPMSPTDPRHAVLQDRINGIRAQISKESELVAGSIARSVKIARARVESLETIVPWIYEHPQFEERFDNTWEPLPQRRS